MKPTFSKKSEISLLNIKQAHLLQSRLRTLNFQLPELKTLTSFHAVLETNPFTYKILKACKNGLSYCGTSIIPLSKKNYIEKMADQLLPIKAMPARLRNHGRDSKDTKIQNAFKIYEKRCTKKYRLEQNSLLTHGFAMAVLELSKKNLTPKDFNELKNYFDATYPDNITTKFHHTTRTRLAQKPPAAVETSKVDDSLPKKPVSEKETFKQSKNITEHPLFGSIIKIARTYANTKKAKDSRKIATQNLTTAFKTYIKTPKELEAFLLNLFSTQAIPLYQSGLTMHVLLDALKAIKELDLKPIFNRLTNALFRQPYQKYMTDQGYLSIEKLQAMAPPKKDSTPFDATDRYGSIPRALGWKMEDTGKYKLHKFVTFGDGDCGFTSTRIPRSFMQHYLTDKNNELLYRFFISENKDDQWKDFKTIIMSDKKYLTSDHVGSMVNLFYGKTILMHSSEQIVDPMLQFKQQAAMAAEDWDEFDRLGILMGNPKTTVSTTNKNKINELFLIKPNKPDTVINIFVENQHYQYASRNPKDPVGKHIAELSKLALNKKARDGTNKSVERFNFTYKA